MVLIVKSDTNIVCDRGKTTIRLTEMFHCQVRYGYLVTEMFHCQVSYGYLVTEMFHCQVRYGCLVKEMFHCQVRYGCLVTVNQIVMTTVEYLYRWLLFSSNVALLVMWCVLCDKCLFYIFWVSVFRVVFYFWLCMCDSGLTLGIVV